MVGRAKTSYDNFQVNYNINGFGKDIKIYINDNMIYMKNGEEKYKASATEEDLENYNLGQIPRNETLIEMLESAKNSLGGLTYEKGEKNGRIYYRMSGIMVSNEGIHIELPLDLYVAFENDKLVEYSIKTFALFAYLEYTVYRSDEPLTLPSNFDDYEYNSTIFKEGIYVN